MPKLEPLKLKQTSNERNISPETLTLPFLDDDSAMRMENRAVELERMMVELQDKAAVAEREAYNKAYQMGEKAGLELGKRRAENIIADLQKLVDAFHGHVDDMYRSLDRQVIMLANAVTKKVVGTSIRDEGVMESLITRAIEETEFDLSSSRLALNPEDIERIRSMLQDKEMPLECAADSGIVQGTARLQSHDGMVSIDAEKSIDHCFDFIRSRVLSGYDGDEAEKQ
ncbi:MAG: FliH/SctL family protein [Mariprofundaceae bacterium]